MSRQDRNGVRQPIECLEGRVMLSATPRVAFHVARPAGAANTFHPTYVMATRPSASGRLAPLVTSAPSGINPLRMRGAYGINSINFGGVTGNGAGQTIAIIDAYDQPTIQSDLHNFDQAFGLADPPSFTKLNENGGTALPGTDPAGKPNDWELEASLDVEWAHAIAPAANIVLYEANTDSDADLISIAANTARRNPNVSVVSMSFGGGESFGQSTDDAVFKTPAGHQGVTFLASTGDSGAPGSYPAFSPNVVAVGGTTLNVSSGGTYLSESGWSSGGGGTSTQEAEPSYQRSVQSSGFRTTPDISIDANPSSGVPVYDSYDNGVSQPWAQIGGTSLAAPMWAGLIAIADQGRVVNGLGTLDGATQTLPMLYNAPASDFHDVTTGNNGNAAGPGYDLVTGRGTPIANLLIPALAGQPVVPVNNTVNGSASGVNTITLKRDANGIDAEVWVNTPEIGQPTQLAVLSQPITINGGTVANTLVLDNANGSPLGSMLTLNGSFSAAALNIEASQTVALGNAGTLTVGSPSIAGGTLDLQNGTLAIFYGPATSPDANVATLVLSGKTGGTGIISSTASSNMAVGYFDQTSSTTELVKATLLGDANLDGKVDVVDLGIVAGNFGTSVGAEWSNGDFTGDGAVDVVDLGLLSGNFGQSIA